MSSLINIGQAIVRELLTKPWVTQVVDCDPGQSLTNAQLLFLVSQRCEQLQALKQSGASRNWLFVVLTGRQSQFWIDILAVWLTGGVAVCVEPEIEAANAQNVLKVTEACYLLGDASQIPDGFKSLTLVNAPVDLASAPEDIAVSAIGDLEGLTRGAVVSPLSEGTAAVIFTSGTTGLPKGIPLSHEQLLSNALSTLQRIGVRSDDRLMIATPFRFISSISHFIVTVIAGAQFIGSEARMMPKDLITLLQKHRITAFGGSPFHLRFIAMAGSKRLPEMRWAMSSGDHLPKQTIKDLLDSFENIEIHVVYGMAELGGRMCSLNPASLQQKAGSVGFPILGYSLALIGDNGAPCAAGEIGDLYVRGANGFRGYLGLAEKNKEVLTEHGFKTGDKGYFDEDGFLFLSGRSDSVFKRSGLKVSTQVIADTITKLKMVEDFHVDSREDLVEGRVPLVYVVTNPAKPFEVKAFIQKLRERLPTNHIPSAVSVLSTIPRTGSGKVDRRALKEVIDAEV